MAQFMKTKTIITLFWFLEGYFWIDSCVHCSIGRALLHGENRNLIYLLSRKATVDVQNDVPEQWPGAFTSGLSLWQRWN